MMRKKILTSQITLYRFLDNVPEKDEIKEKNLKVLDESMKITVKVVQYNVFTR